MSNANNVELILLVLARLVSTILPRIVSSFALALLGLGLTVGSRMFAIIRRARATTAATAAPPLIVLAAPASSVSSSVVSHSSSCEQLWRAWTWSWQIR